MALRPGDAGRTVRERPTGAGPGGVVLADDGTNLIFADAGAAAWLKDDGGGNWTLDDDEAERDGGLFIDGDDILFIG